MGGRALKNTETRRYSKTEFTKGSTQLLRTLRRFFDRADVPRYYHNKETFGDIDIILSMKNYKGNMREFIVEHFSPNEIFHNGNCWSFDYNEVQVDLITVSPEDYDSNYNYLSFNDLGNMIGRIAHGFGLKYGSEGLFLDYRFKSTTTRIMISKDYPKIYQFFGLDYGKWLKGFDELEDIFKFVSECPYFNWKKFQLSELNKINRERNIKRKSYMTLLEWIDNNVADANHEYKFNEDKSSYYKLIDSFFPESKLFDEIARIEYMKTKSIYAATQFNGKLVIDKFGLEGKELGNAMNEFKEHINKTRGSYEDYLIETPRPFIIAEFAKLIFEE